MGEIIIPKYFVDTSGKRVIFLAGPIGNAPNWHDKAMEILFEEDPEIVIASPRREVEDNELAKYIHQGDLTHFPRQRAWERHYLPTAARQGAIMFWLPGPTSKESLHHDPNKVYGAMTRLELGQWMTRYSEDNSLRVCFGSDGGFPEMHTISYDLSIDAPDKQIYSTLKETCQEALRLSRL